MTAGHHERFFLVGVGQEALNVFVGQVNGVWDMAELIRRRVADIGGRRRPAVHYLFYFLDVNFLYGRNSYSLIMRR